MSISVWKLGIVAAAIVVAAIVDGGLGSFVAAAIGDGGPGSTISATEKMAIRD